MNLERLTWSTRVGAAGSRHHLSPSLLVCVSVILVVIVREWRTDLVDVPGVVSGQWDPRIKGCDLMKRELGEAGKHKISCIHVEIVSFIDLCLVSC